MAREGRGRTKVLIARRKLDQTWRDAVSARATEAGASGAGCLAAYDAATRSGAGDAEAAWRALAEAGLLWSVEGGVVPVPEGGAGDVPSV